MARYCGANNPAAPRVLTARRRRAGPEQPARAPTWRGVDNNRNYSVGSYFDGYEGADDATNHTQSCTNETYAGPSELSEPENQNEDWLLDNHPNIKFSMNIHTSGGYFMWSPASYKTQGRVALPYASKGWQEEFWAAAHKTVSAIETYRGTAVTPDRTGPVIDVLYSAAGNESDEAWYKYHLIAYDFECGVDVYSPTTTTNAATNDNRRLPARPSPATRGTTRAG